MKCLHDVGSSDAERRGFANLPVQTFMQKDSTWRILLDRTKPSKIYFRFGFIDFCNLSKRNHLNKRKRSSSREAELQSNRDRTVATAERVQKIRSSTVRRNQINLSDEPPKTFKEPFRKVISQKMENIEFQTSSNWYKEKSRNLLIEGRYGWPGFWFKI